jgi:putative ABC transport system permease protein
MRTRLYWAYALRSLVRDGPRTALAIFAVTVGVLAIVSVQLVGNAVSATLLGNIRAINGGDIHVSSSASPLTAADLAYFDQLQAQGTITTYTAVDAQAVKLTVRGQTSTQRFGMEAIDPSRFPIAGAPVFTNPTSGTLPSLLQGDGAVTTATLAQLEDLHVGDSVRMTALDGHTGELTIRGIIASGGVFQGPVLLMNVSAFATLPTSSTQPLTYSDVYLDVPAHATAQASSVEQRIQQQFPLATVQTPDQLLATQQQQVNQIRYFIQVVGLIALLIGGVSIGNTVQVGLGRRRTEIAMLKTAGYRRRDLYALFGLETALIGLAGGALGALAGLGVSMVGATLVASIFQIALPTAVDPGTLGAGVGIGCTTALIFGLLPIVQASQVRPLAVLRALPEGASWRGRLLTVGLTMLLGALFFIMAQAIVQNLVVAGVLVVGVALLLAMLGGVLWLLVWRVSAVTLPARFRWWFVPLGAAALLIALAAARPSPAFGVVLLTVAALSMVALVLPRGLKAHVTLALRNFGRRKARAVATLLALYIGALSIGLVLVLGANIQTNWTQIATNTHADAVIVAHAGDRAAIDQQLAQMSGASHVQVTTTNNNVVPTAVNGQPMSQFTATLTAMGQYTPSQVVKFLRSIQGYDLAHGQGPDPTLVTIVRGSQDTHLGRNLSSADAGTGNVLVPLAASHPPDNLRLGDTLTLGGSPGASRAGATPTTLTIVGFYTGSLQFGDILMDAPIVTKVDGGNPMYVYTLYLNPANADAQLAQIQRVAPSAWTFSIADSQAQVNTLLNNLMTLLAVIGSLTLFAAVIGIANAVALALLERRRELGILKAVGFTSGTVVGEVLIENAVVGIIAGMLAVLCICAVVPGLGTQLFGQPFVVSPVLAMTVLVGSAALSTVVAAAVAWQPTRVRPLAVLRYE